MRNEQGGISVLTDAPPHPAYAIAFGPFVGAQVTREPFATLMRFVPARVGKVAGRECQILGHQKRVIAAGSK